jgi:hypothetical protein
MKKSRRAFIKKQLEVPQLFRLVEFYQLSALKAMRTFLEQMTKLWYP